MDDGQQLTLQYPSPTPHSIQSGASSASAWSPSQPVGPAHAPEFTAAMFGFTPRQADNIQYGAGSPTAAQFVQQHQRTTVFSTPDAAGQNALPPSRSQPPATLSLAQIESSIGPSRVLTRRQARAQAAQQQQSRTASSLHGAVHEGNAAGQTPPMFYPLSLSTAPLSRPQTPSTATMQSPPYPRPPRPDFISLPNGGLSMSTGHISPPFPSTPLSASPAHSPYNFFRHSRSASNATSNPRSASPALSIVSAMTSVSSASAHGKHGLQPSDTLPAAPMSPVITSEEKKKKGRLTNKDRKDICEYHRNMPDARQEDIAQLWNVERSTISKIIKAKDKWLAVPSEDHWKVAKHKPSKFPEIERELDKWLRQNAQESRPQILSDQIIRNKAKEIARELHIPEEKFKASSGWVENFKHRHTIKRGVWMPGVTGNAWIPDAVVNAQTVGQSEDPNPSAPEPPNPGDRSAMNQDPSSATAWEPSSAQTTASAQAQQLQSSPLSTTLSAPPDARSQVHAQLPSSAEPTTDARMDLTPTPVSQSTLADQHRYHTDLQRNAYYHLGIAAPTPTHPVSFQSQNAAMLSNHLQTSDGMGLSSSVPLSTYSSGDMIYPTTLLKDSDASATTHGLPQGSDPTGSHIQEPRGIPSVKAAEEAMELVLDFFDAQPGLIITADDREKLSQIRCKLYAHASGLAFQREDRAQRRASA